MPKKVVIKQTEEVPDITKMDGVTDWPINTPERQVLVSAALDNNYEPIQEPAQVVEVTTKYQADTMVRVLSNGSFRDGAFTNDFAALGYRTNWPDNTVREIPAKLYYKLQQRSGNRFTLVGGD